MNPWGRFASLGLAAAALLMVIWPANFQDAITTQQGRDTTAQALNWIRFPLQIPLIWFALQSGRDRTGEVLPDGDCHPG